MKSTSTFHYFFKLKVRIVEAVTVTGLLDHAHHPDSNQTLECGTDGVSSSCTNVCSEGRLYLLALLHGTVKAFDVSLKFEDMIDCNSIHIYRQCFSVSVEDRMEFQFSKILLNLALEYGILKFVLLISY